MDFREKKKSVFKILLIVILLIFISISSIISFKSSNVTHNPFDNNISTIKINAPDIIILNPQNITYTQPMSGYYPATYGFENVTDDSLGNSIDFIDEYQNSSLGTEIRMIEESFNGHKNYLRISDNDGSNNTWAVHYIKNPQYLGTIEYYHLFIQNPSGSINQRETIQFRSSSDTIAFQVQFNHQNGSMQYYNGLNWQEIAILNPNIWCHHKIIFDCNSGTNGQFTWIISSEKGEEIARVSNIEFENDFTGDTIDKIYIETSIEDYGLNSYWDAFGFIWDPYYNLGDNLYEGILVSYTNSTQVDWIKYSIDGQNNKTLFGNRVIPILSNGKHSFQAYCRFSNGTTYVLNKIYFSIYITFTSSNPINIGIIISISILSIAGVAIPSTYFVLNYQKNKYSEKKAKNKKIKIQKTYLKKKYFEKYTQLDKSKLPKSKIDSDKLTPIPMEISKEKNELQTADHYSKELVQRFMQEECHDFIDQCTMHKDKFDGPGYECYECHHKYCVKCAFTLAEKNVGCIICGKPIPFLFQKTKKKEIKLKEPQINISKLIEVFGVDNIMEKINQSELDLTFFTKQFYDKFKNLELDSQEKALFLEDMLYLTPEERNYIIDKMITSSINNVNLNEKKSPTQTNKKFMTLHEIFRDENLSEDIINQSEDINVTFFDKKFLEEFESLDLGEEEKSIFLEDMRSLTPEERNQLMIKLKNKNEL
ncbi:MAG: hypothetical protein JXA99_14910 [Candidatus Lokiarchaeota archaeon]|nr:hypothetical protein [Candidatus Lokiarchaeota archaeon]